MLFTRKENKKDPVIKAEIDSPQWRKEHYVVNRDSAYADPRIAITKLIVVLGHAECGAVAAAVERLEDVSCHIVNLINEIKPEVAKCAHYMEILLIMQSAKV